MDSLPSKEREKIRKRLRSPEAYEKLREKVKGPEDLEKEMDRSEKLAEIQFEMETDPEKKEQVKAAVTDKIREVGVEGVVENGIDVSPEARTALEQGKITVSVSSHPVTHEDALTVAPEGNVAEKLPVKQVLSDQWTAQFATKQQA